MMVAYLIVTWMLDVMPCSYYHYDGGVRWWMVGAQVCSQDFLMFALHLFEHKGPLGPEFYRKSHKPHHRFVNPRLFDAFDGSVPDTFCMILIPLAPHGAAAARQRVGVHALRVELVRVALPHPLRNPSPVG